MTYQKSRKTPEKFFSIQEVGAITKASQDQIKKWVSDGILQSVHFADEHRISEEEMNSFIDRCRKGVVRRSSIA